MSHVFLSALSCILVCAGIDIPRNGAGDGMSEQEQMAWLANAVYKFRTPIAGWTLAEKLQLKSGCAQETDNFAIYHYAAGSQCVLAVAGTDSAADMFDNFDGRTVADCGFPEIIHSGYMKEVNDLLNACDFQNRFLPLLTGSQCKNGVSVVGHSLGGGVASVFSACANNPAKPYGFNVSKLWTFGAPAVSRPDVLHNGLATDKCFKGGRFWNQDRLFIDPIPGLSRGLNFFHPRIGATRVREKTTMGIGQGSYTAMDYACGSYQGYEFPNTADGTPYPSLHLMSAYCERTREMYTSDSFSPIAIGADATAAPASLIECKMSVNYTYEEVVTHSAERKDFDGWDITTSSYATCYLISLLVFVALIVAFVRMRAVLGIKQQLAAYYEQTFVKDLLDELKAELDEQQPQDALKFIGDFATKRRDAKFEQHQKKKEEVVMSPLSKTQTGALKETAKSPLLLCASCCGCRSKRKSTRKRRSVAVEFFLYLLWSFPAFFFTAIARNVLNSYESNGDEMGRKWGDANSGWMVPWTMGIIFYSPSMTAAFDIVVTLLAYPDWTVRAGHVVGAIGAAGELQMMWTENLSNTGKISFVIGIVCTFISIVELIVHLIKHRNDEVKMAKLTVWLLLGGVSSIFIGCVVHVSVHCEFPHNDDCPFPEAFSVNSVMHLFFLGAVVLICGAMYNRMLMIEKDGKVHPESEKPM